MLRQQTLDELSISHSKTAVTIGVFDGVHRGHQKIIGHTVTRARSAGLPAVVMTFEPNPIEIVRPGTRIPILTTLDRKAELFEGLGVTSLCVVPFTSEFSQLSAEQFVQQILADKLHVKHVVVGENFRYGNAAKGDFALLRKLGDDLGFTTEAISLYGLDQTPISSTQIRERLAAGDVAGAGEALGRPHRLRGCVVRGAGRGRKLGFATANLSIEPHAALPADGVYAGYAVRGAHSLVAAISVGTNPTFQATERHVEAHILDFDEDIYDEKISIDFIVRLRDMTRFDHVDELIAAMENDVLLTRHLLPLM